jgi:CemA family
MAIQLKNILNAAGEWFSKTPQRALNRSYRAALKIKDIEDKHFNGQKVSSQFSDYGESVIAYFKTEVRGYLQTINAGLTEFKASRFFFNLSDFYKRQSEGQETLIEEQNAALTILERLKFIDEIVSKYKTTRLENRQVDISLTKAYQNLPTNDVENKSLSLESYSLNSKKNGKEGLYIDPSDFKTRSRAEKASETRGVLPRSFLNTLNKIRLEIDPESGETEEEVIKRYRNSRYKTAISIKFILLLIIVPLLTHQLAKVTFVSPLVNSYMEKNPQVIFINQDVEEEALVKLKNFEEMLLFKRKIGLTNLSSEEIEEQVNEKATEISEKSRRDGADAIANIFADLFSLIAFGAVIAANKKEIEIVKTFLDEIVYGLSDSAKAFLIILLTDIFVGYHSPHGWEVILENVSRHFGLPENRDFNFLFIATFPVILDTVFKYWIFRYLNRLSPSAVATYKNMNE